MIYADGVGTGKTEIGLALIEEYTLRRGFHALVVAPAQLVSLWQERLNQTRLSAQLEAAICRKIVAARPYGMEIEVMESDVDEEIQSYARRLADGDVTLIDEPRAAGEPQGTSAESLRAELHRAGAEGELHRVQELTWGVGAAFAALRVWGGSRGLGFNQFGLDIDRRTLKQISTVRMSYLSLGSWCGL